MTKPPIVDFSHLSAAERVELAEQLWDSLAEVATPLTEAQTAELQRRRALLEAEGDLGSPWEQVMDDIEQHGG